MHLRVLTYNIHRAIGLDRRFRPERIIGVLRHYQADIVLLQEVDEGAPRSRELDLAKELALAADYPHYAVGHNVSLRKGRYGNATLSRFPILRERNIDLTIGNKKRRGCQHTSINIDDSQQIEVFNLHLGLSAQERKQQLELLVRSREFEATHLSHASIVGGDFNDWRSQLVPLLTRHQGLTCATNYSGRRNGPIRTYPSFSPTGGLDKIFFHGKLKPMHSFGCRLGISKIASDHIPVIADFRMH
ncbi:MAG: endonuclease/exonuclease/phosphatase family protein [Gammaproteobacteria bacterium]|nr:endonuclease/exonuclease/phosphatase family protein [Gammaproteobacteria bacterium]